MKLLFSSVFLFLLVEFNFAQKYEKFTNEEKSLIESNSTEMMRVYNLVNDTDSIVLNSISKPIDPKDKFTKLLAGRMLLSVNDPEHKGVGIAAPQVGINRRMVLVQRFDKENKPFELFINPEIIWSSELMQKGTEGDLSFEDRGEVMRHYIVQVKYFNLNGEVITEILEGFTSVIFQHEHDHLDGILLTDRIEEQKTKTYQYAPGTTNLYFLID